jgi:hypothetical protein
MPVWLFAGLCLAGGVVTHVTWLLLACLLSDGETRVLAVEIRPVLQQNGLLSLSAWSQLWDIASVGLLLGDR